VKLVQLLGFIIKKFVTMHSHMNVKFCDSEFNHQQQWEHPWLLQDRTLYHPYDKLLTTSYAIRRVGTAKNSVLTACIHS